MEKEKQKSIALALHEQTDLQSFGCLEVSDVSDEQHGDSSCIVRKPRRLRVEGIRHTT